MTIIELVSMLLLASLTFVCIYLATGGRRPRG
jgi:hypothetical protein